MVLGLPFVSPRQGDGTLARLTFQSKRHDAFFSCTHRLMHVLLLRLVDD